MFLRNEPRPPLELWGGIECTVNRVGDDYFDQLEASGHARRAADLERFAALGLRTLRYPLLWERTQATPGVAIDWAWADRRLGRLRTLGIAPILGLVHHGSGPRHTRLDDPSFGDGLAAYARAVAERFPWVERYTPVNEPLTTARFSGLYGHWYPHGRDGLTFARALLGECRATVLAMRAIRSVRPTAELVQTEDLGKTFSTPELSYQAEFENERRWLSWDLLCGRVDGPHPLWGYLRWVGLAERELAWFLDNQCPPDVLGINYYATSERFLDQRIERYPAHTHGGNGRDRYADVEAVRVRPEGLAGAAARLAEAWERYRRPLAITEVHLGCWREEQLRWLAEVWRDADRQRACGADVRAVTTWALLGSFDWDSLVTRQAGSYESGAFDLRAPEPRLTSLARLVGMLTAGRAPGHPVLDTPGWWRRPERLVYDAPEPAVPAEEPRDVSPRVILIVGATGTLGRAFDRVCAVRGLARCLWGRADLDIAEAASVEAGLDRLRPWAVVNAAGYVRVDAAESEPERCFRENARGPANLAAACARRGIPLVTFSSDLVFDGRRRRPYTEDDSVCPLNVYGRSKAAAEALVLKTCPAALVVRTSAFFGPWDEYNFMTVALRQLARGELFHAPEDAFVSPTYVPDLVHACLDLLVDGEQGVWHLAHPEVVSWAELARRAAGRAGLDPGRVRGCRTADLNLPARRPRYSALASRRGTLLRPLDHGLERYLADRKVALT